MQNPRQPGLQGYELSQGLFPFICRRFVEHLLCATLMLRPEHTVGATCAAPPSGGYSLLGTWTQVDDCRTE